MLITVYDPKGRMFEVTPHIARTAIIVHGWTSVPPAQVKPVFGVDQQVGVEQKPSEIFTDTNVEVVDLDHTDSGTA